MTGVYLELFHGRKSRLTSMDEWGELGPILGPFRFVHTTYNSDLKVKLIASNKQDAIDGELVIVSAMVYYDGYYYGDWSIYSEEIAHEHRDRIQTFDPEKAKHARRPSGKVKASAYLQDDGRPGEVHR